MKTPPRPLVAIALLYLASEVLLLVVNPKAMGFVRLAVYTYLLYFVVGGSRTAARAWSGMALLGALLTGVSAAEKRLAEPGSSLVLAGFAFFLLGSAAYCTFSKSVRRFQDAHGKGQCGLTHPSSGQPQDTLESAAHVER
jgi:hypothetical protein